MVIRVRKGRIRKRIKEDKEKVLMVF